jgi:hypothetical protein
MSENIYNTKPTQAEELKEEKKREFRLKRIKRITEENLNLIRDSRGDLYLTLILCVFAIIIGITFLTLKGLDRGKFLPLKLYQIL